MKQRRKTEPLVTRAPRRQNSYLMPTLLDRLADHAPHRLHESPGEYAVTRTQMRDVILRDLAYLLNTTNFGKEIDREQYPEAAASTINYGVPPLTGEYAASRAWVDIERDILRAILDFEPRLIPETLSISRLKGTDGSRYNNLTFEIHGEIQLDPYPLEFTVQSTLDLETGQLHVTGRRAG